MTLSTHSSIDHLALCLAYLNMPRWLVSSGVVDSCCTLAKTEDEALYSLIVKLPTIADLL